MQARYRYRIEPTEAQRAVLARTFGCVRVVFIARLATIATSDGGCATIANPKHLARKQRTLARLEREIARLLKEKAERYGRTVCTVSRWLPSSKTCSACGVVRAERQNACGASVSPPCGEEAGSTPGAA